jgi:hypothetical protein
MLTVIIIELAINVPSTVLAISIEYDSHGRKSISSKFFNSVTG